MLQTCLFSGGRDIMATIPDCSPNITKAIESGSIENRDVPALFNQIEAIEDIGNLSRDIFDMVSYTNAVKKFTSQDRKELEKV